MGSIYCVDLCNPHTYHIQGAHPAFFKAKIGGKVWVSV